jgi:ACR3 family arsenite efflux pump ArsB
MLAGGIYRWLFLRTRKTSAGSVQRPSVYLSRQFLRGPVPPVRLSSDTPISNAFWRLAPSVLLSFLAIPLALAYGLRVVSLRLYSTSALNQQRTLKSL